MADRMEFTRWDNPGLAAITMWFVVAAQANVKPATGWITVGQFFRASMRTVVSIWRVELFSLPKGPRSAATIATMALRAATERTE